MKHSDIRDYYGSGHHKSLHVQMFEIVPGYMSFGFSPSTLLIREIK